LYSEVQDLSKNLENRVKEQVRQIEQLSEMKSEFLKIVNHQLRTQVSIIKGMAAMLAEGSLKPEKRDDFIKKVYLSSERLETILDDILLAQSLVGQVEPVKFSPCQVEEIIEKQVEHFKEQAEMKGLKIIFNKPKQPLPLTLADPEMLERAVSRLIDNAILYTEKGEVRVSVNLKKEKEKDFIEISVQDSGIGLEEEDKKNLFKLFHRGKKATLLHPNGSGLGLFIVKELIRFHQGKVEVQSQGKDQGSIFTITLPIIVEI
jgi:signal transduction histidine kinase